MEENKKVESQSVDLSAEQQLGLQVATLPAPEPAHDVPTLWKTFGGAIVSIIFMLIVTIFGYIITNLNNLQHSINSLNAETVKKAEFNERITHIWQKVGEAGSLKEKCATTDQRILTLENQVKALQEENKTQNRDLQALRERIVAIEAAQKKQ